MSLPKLTDRERIEFALPCAMLYKLVTSGCFASVDAADEAEGKAEVERQTARLKALLRTAADDPFADVPLPRERAKLERRANRVLGQVTAGWVGTNSARLALATHFFLAELIDREVLAIIEGTALAEAVALLFPMFEHAAHDPEHDAAARAMKDKIVLHLLREGYYPLLRCTGPGDAGTPSVGAAVHA